MTLRVSDDGQHRRDAGGLVQGGLDGGRRAGRVDDVDGDVWPGHGVKLLADDVGHLDAGVGVDDQDAHGPPRVRVRVGPGSVAAWESGGKRWRWYGGTGV